MSEVGIPLICFENKRPSGKLHVLGLALSMVFLSSILSYGQEEPTTAVKSMVDEVLNILKKEELKGPEQTQERRTLLENAVGRRLDYAEMAKRTLALHWRKRTPSEQKDFVDTFYTFLSKTYAKRLETYSDEAVQYTKVRLKDPYAEVQTKVASAKTELSLDYRLLRKTDRWWIYDIVVNGVSLVRNYRDQFDRIIRTSSYDELVSKLRDRTDEIANP
jgi:phospholipid transport system substrate-binding protein